uniref:Uncharacterized protein n=1 Tax=Guillardia theta TaxID=55529 RepID=A0A7S4KE71_GUITH
MHKEYAKEWYRREWEKLAQRQELAEQAKQAGMRDGNYMEWYSRGAKHVCLYMHREQRKHVVLKEGDGFSSVAPFSLRMRGGDVTQQLGYWLLRGSLTRVKHNKREGSLEVSFVHDLYRSFFLAEATLEELRKKEDGQADEAVRVPASLSVRNLRGEVETIKEHAIVVQGKRKYQERLFDVMRASREDGSEETGRASANAATILVAASVSWSGLDLSGVRVAGQS